MRSIKISVTTTGGAGVSAGNATSQDVITGKLHAVYLNYAATAPGTTDVTISMPEAPEQTLLTVSNNATDGWYLPRQAVCDTAGAGLTYDGTRTVNEPLPVDGRIKLTVAQSNDLTDCVTAYLYIED
jgi:hypothetical protein